MIAAHDWDLTGARVAGLRTAFLNRGGPKPVTIEVDREAETLTALKL